jgi:hypothetical protein
LRRAARAESHVGQGPLDVAQTGGEGLHVGQTPVDLLEPLAHELQSLADEGEALLDAALERGLELLVHARADVFQLRLQGLHQLVLEILRVADGFGADLVEVVAVVGLDVPQLGRHRGQLTLLGVGQMAQRGQRMIAQRPDRGVGEVSDVLGEGVGLHLLQARQLLQSAHEGVGHAP